MSQRITTVFTSLALIGAIFASVPSSVRANGFDPQDNTWVATSGIANEVNAGTSCADPGFVTDGTNDEVEVGYAVLDVNDGGTVHLCPGTYHFDAGVFTGKNFALIGAGATSTVIDGGNTSRIIVTEGNLDVESLTMQNARGFDGYEGGAILGLGRVEVANVIFRNNFANKGGGAIAAEGVVVAYDSVFTSNTANDQGGAIASHSFVQAYDSSFTSNSSIADEACVGGGGAIAAADDVFVERSTFTRNTAVVSTDLATCEDNGNFGGSGGAIGTLGFAFVQDSVFSNNSAVIAGGAILSLDLAPTRDVSTAIERSTFVKNRAGSGGAVYVQSNVLDITISGCLFKGNSAKVVGAKGSQLRIFSGFGGAIYAVNYAGDLPPEPGSITMTGNRFSQNRASVSGGGVYLAIGVAEVLATMSRNRFVANSAGKSGGAIGYNSTEDSSPPTRSQLRQALRANRFSGNAAARGPVIGSFNLPIVN